MARRERMQRKGNHSWMRGNKFLWQQNMQEWNLLKFQLSWRRVQGKVETAVARRTGVLHI